MLQVQAASPTGPLQRLWQQMVGCVRLADAMTQQLRGKVPARAIQIEMRVGHAGTDWGPGWGGCSHPAGAHGDWGRRRMHVVVLR